MHKAHLLTFGAGHPDYIQVLKRIEDEAKVSNLFSTISVNNRETIEELYPDFIRDHGAFIDENKKGYGLWLWKPYLISKLLERLPADEMLVYVDAGCTINSRTPEAAATFNNYLDIAFEQQVLGFQRLDHPTYFREATWTRKDLTDHLEISEVDLDSGQMEANTIFLRVGDYSREFVDTWFRLMTENDYKFLRSPGPENQHLGFCEHRFDQAVYSAIYKKRGLKSVPAQYFGRRWEELGLGEPFWPTRKRPVFK
jgi:hypothetical protein